jgi:hypothetical protein
MMKFIFPVLFCLLMPVFSIAQEGNDWKLFKSQKEDSLKKTSEISLWRTGQPGQVKILKDTRIDQLSEYVGTPQNGKPTVTMRGFRIQAFLDQDKNQVNAKRAEYLNQFREQPAYVDYLAPNFRLRIGDFRTKLDAQAYLEKIKVLFPDAVIVMDDIELPRLEN